MSVWRESEHYFQTKKAYGVRVSNIEKNIHSKNHAFGSPIVLTLRRYARFWQPFSKNTFCTSPNDKKNLDKSWQIRSSPGYAKPAPFKSCYRWLNTLSFDSTTRWGDPAHWNPTGDSAGSLFFCCKCDKKCQELYLFREIYQSLFPERLTAYVHSRVTKHYMKIETLQSPPLTIFFSVQKRSYIHFRVFKSEVGGCKHVRPQQGNFPVWARGVPG